MSFHRPFRRMAALAACAVAALVLLTPVLPARAQLAQTAQQAALSDSAKSDAAKPTAGTGNVAAVDPANPSPQKSLAAKAIDKVKQVAKSAGDIFSRVPCVQPKGAAKAMGSLPHVAGKLASGAPVVIIAFGSSSTSGYGTTSPEFTYPNRLAAQLRRQYPGAEISVVRPARM